MWWKDEIKTTVRRKEAAWKEVLAARSEEAEERCMEVNRERLKGQSKMKINEQFKIKMNEDVNGNRKLFWKEVSNAKEEKVESCKRRKRGELAHGEDEGQKI